MTPGFRFASSIISRTVLTLTDGWATSISGDEFTIFIPLIEKTDNARQVATRILSSLAKPCTIANQEIFLTSSIGIAVFPDDGEDLDTLIKHADIAMSHAKQQGKNTYQFYSAEINARSERRLSLETQLHKAVARGEISLHYQPKVNISNGAIIGAEALMRWNHSEFGMIPPLEFIPIAEDSGLITELGAWALHTASTRCKQWQAGGLGALCISVNVSSQQFRQDGLIRIIRDSLTQAKLDPRYLVIELTESMIMANPTESVAALREIKEMGLKLSVDDFGTGYSSLSYLKRFPLDELKVDCSFIKDIPDDADDAAITATIITLAHSLGLSVVAEGVETEAQLQFLKNVYCDEFQGYYFSKPLPEAEFVALLQDKNKKSGG
ncbi:MAG: bifunctional diguanylate cyclase/phosphodiesterase [Pseudomonadota bacterium]